MAELTASNFAEVAASGAQTGLAAATPEQLVAEMIRRIDANESSSASSTSEQLAASEASERKAVAALATVIADGLFGGRDPNRPRPVLDAIKSLLTGFITELGPELKGMLIPLLLKLLRGFAG